jgi:TolB-like protein/Tfp pilus assembly protein PilF
MISGLSPSSLSGGLRGVDRTRGKFRLLEPLGRGGQGTVWKAEDTLRGRIVALKLFEGPLIHTREFRARFESEARAASTLDHPGIAGASEAEIADEFAHIVFRFVEGEDLSERIARAPLSPSEAMRIGRDLASALAHAHAAGVLHRDVKCPNIRITSDGHAVLLDFGIAAIRGATRVTQTGQLVGTIGYVAPEVLRGADASPRSDLYSLGVVLFESLTGHMPFRGEKPDALWHQATTRDAPRPSELDARIPAPVDGLVHGLLSRDPADRPADARALEAAIERVESGIRPGLATNVRAALQRVVVRPVRRVSRWLRLVLGLEPRPATLFAWAGFGARAVVLLGIVGFAGLGTREILRPPISRLAVIPFEVSGPDSASAARTATGVASDLVDRLQSIHGLTVLPWVTSSQFGYGRQAPHEAASTLRVGALVLGHVQQARGRIQLKISLVDGRSGRQIWSRLYDRPRDELFGMQERIALDLADVAKARLGSADRTAIAAAPSTSVAAYEFYLQGSELVQHETEASGEEATDYFQRALELDPKLAAAYVGLGSVYSNRYFRGYAGGELNLELAERAYKRALSLKPDLANAQRGLLWIYTWKGCPVDSMLSLAQEGSRDTNNNIDRLLLAAEGYLAADVSADWAKRYYERILELDPANRGAQWFLTLACVWAEDYEQGLAAGRRYTQRFGEDPEILFWMAKASDYMGDPETAWPLYREALDLFEEGTSNGYAYVQTADFLLRQQRITESRAVCDEGIRWARDKLDPYPDQFRVHGFLAGMYAVKGDRAAYARERTWILDEVHRLQRPPTQALAFNDWRFGDFAAGDSLLAATFRSHQPDFSGIRLQGGVAFDRRESQHLRGTPLLAEMIRLRNELRTRYAPIHLPASPAQPAPHST